MRRSMKSGTIDGRQTRSLRQKKPSTPAQDGRGSAWIHSSSRTVSCSCRKAVSPSGRLRLGRSPDSFSVQSGPPVRHRQPRRNSADRRCSRQFCRSRHRRVFKTVCGARRVDQQVHRCAVRGMMPRNVVSGRIHQGRAARVPRKQNPDRERTSSAGRFCGPGFFGLRLAIAHGPGDQAWADKAAREMIESETRYNRSRE